MNTAVHFSSMRTDWSTPSHVYAALDREFHFTLDPCREGDEGGLFGKRDGLLMDWAGHRIFANPPYGDTLPDWLRRGPEADLAVFLVPARTDTAWFHDLCLPLAKEIRFIRGRLQFGGVRKDAPFPSMIVVYAR
jgi:hypothetical protein